MYFLFFIIYLIGSFIISFYLTKKLKDMFLELFEGRIRRLEMEVDEIELKLTKRADN